MSYVSDTLEACFGLRKDQIEQTIAVQQILLDAIDERF